MAETEPTTPPEWPPDWWDFGPADASGAGGSEDPGGRRPAGIDLGPLLLLIEGVRRALPAELQEQFNALVREVLLTIRALIDWYLERSDPGPREPPVEDIPID